MKTKVTLALSLTAALMVTVFQNCSAARFTSTSGDALSNAADIPDVDPPTVICDPFSNSTGNCPTTPPDPQNPGNNPGLKSNVYYLPNAKGVDTYINMGEKLPILVILSNLDIPLRSWQAGFPGADGKALQTSKKEDLIEYFALDLQGYFTLPAAVAEGEYQFATHSDDGSVLYMDGSVVVDNDGDHPMTWKCASAASSLKHSDKHPLRLKYYQGPRTEIGLQVYMRPAADMNKPCDASGGWTIIPSAGLSY